MSLRRSVAKLASEGLWKFSPNLGPYFNAHLPWHPLLHNSTNFCKNLGSSNQSKNYRKFLEDPELPKLIKLYQQVCRGCHKKPTDYTKLKKTELDNPPKSFWKTNIELSRSSSHHRKHSRLDLNNPAEKTRQKAHSPETTTKTKKTDMSRSSSHHRKHSRLDLNNPAEKIRQKAHTPETTTKTKKRVKHQPKNKKNNSSKQKSLKISRPRITKHKLPKSFLYKQKSDSEDRVSQELKLGKKYQIGLRFFGSDFSFKFIRRPREKSLPDHDTANEDDNQKGIPDTHKQLIEKQSSIFRSFSGVPIGFPITESEYTLSWLPRANLVNVNSHIVDSYHFAPIDINEYKDDFLSQHSLEPEAFERRWPKVPWPTPLKPKPRKAEKDNLQRATKKIAKKVFNDKNFKAAKPYKYHLLRFQIYKRICRKSRRSKTSQTNEKHNGCELCNFCRPIRQPDEPFIIEMKKREEREELKRYYLRMHRKSQESCTSRISVPEQCIQSSENRKSCSSTLERMRHQLEQCQTLLNLCDRLVEARLLYSRTFQDAQNTSKT
ncbi:uncharacterized protein LOC108093910 [Drosophila ficusphila]|uniref:uncharacterized protein LOC108093910 n=1 Tax=Drosophila ficusphila TaxID=30025 RepID=UPI0007E62867|nr:uncharacterized protein LOC108093910 [Drosophila ficusphila]